MPAYIGGSVMNDSVSVKYCINRIFQNKINRIEIGRTYPC